MFWLFWQFIGLCIGIGLLMLGIFAAIGVPAMLIRWFPGSKKSSVQPKAASCKCGFPGCAGHEIVEDGDDIFVTRNPRPLAGA